ncbi:MAG: sugar ABC transporter ATP-binding protein [Solirubrobacterales bacterium]
MNLTVGEGDVHALLGGNGSGKSTLIKIMAGVESADSGQLEVHGSLRDLRGFTPTAARNLGLHFVHQQRSTFADLSLTENLALGRGFESSSPWKINWRRSRRRAAAVLERFNIDARPDQILGELGPAKQTMVAIARALQDQDEESKDVLVLDEPTASLPAREVEFLLAALKEYAEAGQAIIYVTHRLGEALDVASAATILRDGKLVATVDPRTLTHDDLVEVMLGRRVEAITRRRAEAGAVDGAVMLKAKNIAVGPLKDLSFEVRGGEILGVAGLIGSGRSTLLKALFGVRSIEAGELRLDGHELLLANAAAAMAAGLGYIPEDRPSEAAFPELSVAENLSVAVVPDYWRSGLLRLRREAADARDLKDSFLIKTASIDAPLSSLSGGNQQKVILARWIRREPRLLLLDEPTQGVDVGARAEIYELIQQAVAGGSSAMVASSDFEELAALCDRILVLGGGGLRAELQRSEISADLIAHTANVGAPV